MGAPPPSWAVRGWKSLAPSRLGGRYGLFARMTTTRDEIILRELHALPEDVARAAGREVSPSQDGRYWVELALPYKPGPVDRPPPWLLSHMPRLDWQLWFASLSWARSGSAPPILPRL